MSPFVTFMDEDKTGELQYYILQREFPHFVGLIAHQKAESTLTQQPILGYNLWIIFAGTIRGNFIPSYQNIQKEVDAVFLEMSNWFYQHRVLANPKKYKKYVSVPR